MTANKKLINDNIDVDDSRILNPNFTQPGDSIAGYYLSLYGCGATLIGDFQGTTYGITAAHCGVGNGTTVYYNDPFSDYQTGGNNISMNQTYNYDYNNPVGYANDFTLFTTTDIIQDGTYPNNQLPWQLPENLPPAEYTSHPYSIPTTSDALYMILYKNSAGSLFEKNGSTLFVSGYGSEDGTDPAPEQPNPLSTNHLATTPITYHGHGSSGCDAIFSSEDQADSNYVTVHCSQNMSGNYDYEANEGIDACQGDSGGPGVAVLHKTAATTQTTPSLDLNGDGYVDVGDISLLAQSIVNGNCTLDPNSDGDCNVLDIIELVNCVFDDNCPNPSSTEPMLTLYETNLDTSISTLYLPYNDYNQNVKAGAAIPLHAGVVSWGYGCGDEGHPGVMTDPAALLSNVCEELINSTDERAWRDYIVMDNNIETAVEEMRELSNKINAGDVGPHDYLTIQCTAHEILEHSENNIVEYEHGDLFSNKDTAFLETVIEELENELNIFEEIIMKHWFKPDAEFGQYDCAGVFEGDNVIDDCGVCDTNPSNDNTTCVEDCSGQMGGDDMPFQCLSYDSDNPETMNHFACVAADYNDICGAPSPDSTECTALEGYTEDCDNLYCVPTSWLGDDACQDEASGIDLFSCNPAESDSQACSPCGPGQVLDCDGSGECHPGSWIGDGYGDCEDQQFGADLTCYDNDGGDCGPVDPVCGDGSCNGDETSDTCPADCMQPGQCPTGYVADCDGTGQCWLENWIGDGFPDCEDQQYGADLTCYENDGGDCDSFI